jgi:chemotaxis protein MotB
MRTNIRLTTAARKAALATTLVAITGLGTGCVSQSEHDKLWETNRSLTQQNAELRSRLDSLGASNASLQGTAGSAESVITQLRADNATLRQQLSSAQSNLSRFEDRMNELSFVSLDPATDRALRQLASEYPDLIVYDADRGMVRLTSDLTFGSGSDQVQSGAMDSLKRLAQVLSSIDGSDYDIQIAGHTDDRKPGASTRRNHPTNMHLSAHRAIAVRNVLGNAGVPWERMSVMGWGEYRPAVPNNPSTGTAANRRVEIFLTPSSWDGSSMSTDTPAQDTSAPASNPGSGIDPIK